MACIIHFTDARGRICTTVRAAVTWCKASRGLYFARLNQRDALKVWHAGAVPLSVQVADFSPEDAHRVDVVAAARGAESWPAIIDALRHDMGGHPFCFWAPISRRTFDAIRDGAREVMDTPTPRPADVARYDAPRPSDGSPRLGLPATPPYSGV